MPFTHGGSRRFSPSARPPNTVVLPVLEPRENPRQQVEGAGVIVDDNPES